MCRPFRWRMKVDRWGLVCLNLLSPSLEPWRSGEFYVQKWLSNYLCRHYPSFDASPLKNTMTCKGERLALLDSGINCMLGQPLNGCHWRTQDTTTHGCVSNTGSYDTTTGWMFEGRELQGDWTRCSFGGRFPSYINKDEMIPCFPQDYAALV